MCGTDYHENAYRIGRCILAPALKTFFFFFFSFLLYCDLISYLAILPGSFFRHQDDWLFITCFNIHFERVGFVSWCSGRESSGKEGCFDMNIFAPVYYQFIMCIESFRCINIKPFIVSFIVLLQRIISEVKRKGKIEVPSPPSIGRAELGGELPAKSVRKENNFSPPEPAASSTLSTLLFFYCFVSSLYSLQSLDGALILHYG